MEKSPLEAGATGESQVARTQELSKKFAAPSRTSERSLFVLEPNGS